MDIPPRGGGTWLCEDGLGSKCIKGCIITLLTELSGVCKHLYGQPKELDPALTARDLTNGVFNCDVFAAVEAKKGDVIVMHGLLPHCVSYNYLHYARVITNVHVMLREPLRLNRPDQNYVSSTPFFPQDTDIHSNV